MANNSLVYLDNKEYKVLQSFLGHGPITKTKYLFMGREEGLGDAGGDPKESCRKRLSWYKEIPDALGHITTEGDWSDGFFIEKPEKTKRVAVKSQTMLYQAYAKLVLDSNLSKFRNQISPEMMKKCMVDSLHTSSSNTAMTELYPLPKQGKLSYQVQGERWDSYKEARESWERPNNHRRTLLTKLYNNFPVPITFCYAGVERGKFIARSFFECLLFDLYERTTSELPLEFINKIQPSSEPKTILIGERISPIGHRQRIILSPFWGQGCLKYDDLNVILAWAVS